MVFLLKVDVHVYYKCIYVYFNSCYAAVAWELLSEVLFLNFVQVVDSSDVVVQVSAGIISLATCFLFFNCKLCVMIRAGFFIDNTTVLFV